MDLGCTSGSKRREDVQSSGFSLPWMLGALKSGFVEALDGLLDREVLV